MPSDANRQFLDFERPIKDLIDEIANMKHRQEKTKLDLSDTIKKLEDSIEKVIGTLKRLGYAPEHT